MQCAAVVTMRGWINVPVHEPHAFTDTVLGHSQASAVSPPTTACASADTSGGASCPSECGASAQPKPARTRVRQDATTKRDRGSSTCCPNRQKSAFSTSHSPHCAQKSFGVDEYQRSVHRQLRF